MTGFLSSLGGVCLQRRSPSRLGQSNAASGLASATSNQTEQRKMNSLCNSNQDLQYCPVTQ